VCLLSFWHAMLSCLLDPVLTCFPVAYFRIFPHPYFLFSSGFLLTDDCTRTFLSSCTYIHAFPALQPQSPSHGPPLSLGPLIHALRSHFVYISYPLTTLVSTAWILAPFLIRQFLCSRVHDHILPRVYSNSSSLLQEVETREERDRRLTFKREGMSGCMA
jgi:hypothetical protein